jgi:hypothetical protein
LGSDDRRVSQRPFPDGLDAQALGAERRVLSRSAPPRIKITRGKKGWRFDNPYPKEHDGDWYFLLLDAFGTRHGGVLDHFLNSICDLVPEGDKWVARDKRAYWYPSEPDFNAALAIIASLKPENEAQAAHAAQLVALHLSAMKLGNQAARYGSERTTAILAKTTRAYGEGIERMARLQGKVQPKQVNQTIQVVYVDQRDERWMQSARGDTQNGGQPHGATGSSSIPCPALPGPCPNRSELSLSRSAGETGLPRSWWGARLWRAFRAS